MRPINWSNPINWRHPLNRDLTRWWLSVPHFANKNVLYDLTKSNHGTLNNMESADIGAGPGGLFHIAFGGTDEYMGGVIPSGFGYPFTIAAVARAPDITARAEIMSVNESGATNKFNELVFAGATTGDPVEARVKFGIGGDAAASSIAYLANTWHVVMGVFLSTTSRTVYLDGGNSGIETTNISAPTWNTVDVGRLGDSTPDYGVLDIVSAALWTRALTSVEASEYYRQYIRGFSDILNSVRRRPIYSPAA